jgi:hypothetical protein
MEYTGRLLSLPHEGAVRGAGGEVPRGAGEGDPQGHRQPRLLQVHQPRRHSAGQVHSLQIIIICAHPDPGFF